MLIVSNKKCQYNYTFLIQYAEVNLHNKDKVQIYDDINFLIYVFNKKNLMRMFKKKKLVSSVFHAL